MLRLRRLKRASKVNTLTPMNTGVAAQSECEVNTIHLAVIVTAEIQYRQALAGHRGRMVGTCKRNGKGTANSRRGAGSRGKGNASGYFGCGDPLLLGKTHVSEAITVRAPVKECQGLALIRQGSESLETGCPRAMRAGNSLKTAGQISDENLKKPQIQSALSTRSIDPELLGKTCIHPTKNKQSTKEHM